LKDNSCSLKKSSDSGTSNTWWIVLLVLLALGIIGYGIYHIVSKRHKKKIGEALDQMNQD